MAYTPTEWQTGDTVTAEKLNNIENGIAEIESGITDVIMPSIPSVAVFYASIASAGDSLAELPFTPMDIISSVVIDELNKVPILVVSAEDGSGTEIYMFNRFVFNPDASDGKFTIVCSEWMGRTFIANSVAEPFRSTGQPK